MSETPSGERIESVDDVAPADVADRVQKDPDEQENREETSATEGKPVTDQPRD